MTRRTIELIDADHAAVASAARILTSRYRQFVSYEDVQQEAYAWLCQNYAKVQTWREEDEATHAERKVVKALRNAADRYCRAEKAQREGYAPDDEFFYSIPMVTDLLRLHFDPDWMVRSADAFAERTSGGRPASEGGNLLAMVADVGRAYAEMPEHDRILLAQVYCDTEPTDEIAALSIEWECTFSAAYNRVRRVVGRLRAALGGSSPYQDDE